MTPDLTTWILLFLQFILLSPGLFLTLPSDSRQQCANFGISDCALPSAQSINCNKCTSVWASNFTSRWAIAVHTLIFFAISQLTLIWVPSSF